jgi:hypothetical protein
MAAWTHPSISLISFFMGIAKEKVVKYTKKKALSQTGTASEAHGRFHKISNQRLDTIAEVTPVRKVFSKMFAVVAVVAVVVGIDVA